MNFTRKVFSIIMSAAICMSFIAGAASAAVTDVNKMAAALNRLNILQGSGGDYLLGAKIERAQAAAIIIRMLGKENYVKQNAEQFKYTKYTDVPSKEWFAPYVGYGTQIGIIAGYNDGSFAPKEYISEKAFVKMALTALGYAYGGGRDFVWENVYQKAFAAGIVTDQSYISRIQDNDNYLRSDAVRVVFNSLNAFKKGTQSKMVFTLVNEGVFTRDFIMASGILGADKATEIDVVTAAAANRIEINLNEPIQSVNAADITIIDAASTGGGLAVVGAAFTGDRIQVITAGQVPGKNYAVRINSVTDAAGNVSGQLYSAFKGFVRQQVVSDFFKISKIEQISSNVLYIYFTHPLNTNSETAAYYELVKNSATLVPGTAHNFTVKKLQSAGNAVSIFVKNTVLSQGEVYSLKVSGRLTSSYGVKLGEGLGESMEFVATAAEAGQLSVSSVQAWTGASVRVIFNREVDAVWAGNRLNYTIYDANKTTIAVTNAVISGSGESGGRAVMLSLASPLDRTKQYEIRMEYVPDIYKHSIIEGKSFPFGGFYPENSELALSQAASDYNNSAVLLFNRALDESAAANKANYIIRGVSDGSFNVIPEKAYYEDMYGMFAVKLFLPAGKTFNSSQKYKVYVAGLKDSLGTAQLPVLQAEFTGSGNSDVWPRPADAVTVSKDAVRVLFNKEIALEPNNIKTSNYALEYVENGETLKLDPIGVMYVDPTTLVLRFDELNPAKTYLLRVNSITDYSGIYSRTTAEGRNTITVRMGK